MKERRKQQNRCESCFEDNQLIFLAPFGCSTICRDCAMQISLCPSIGCGKEITRICSTRGELETAVTQLEERAARRKRQRKNREASWRSLFENECSCRGDNEDDDEEDDDDGGSLSDDFLVDDDLADTNDDERQDVTFWARVIREMDRRAGEKEEEPPDEEEDPDDDPTEAETPLDVCCFRSHRAWNCWSGRPAGCWKYTARAPSRNKGKETAKRGHRKAS